MVTVAAMASKCDDEEKLREVDEVPTFTVVAPGVNVNSNGSVKPTAESKLGMLYTEARLGA